MTMIAKAQSPAAILNSLGALKSLLLNDFPAGRHTAYSVDLAETALHFEQTCSDL